MAITWKKSDLPTLAEKKSKEMSQICQDLIYAGIDVDLSEGTEHFSLEPHDQTNIDSMFTAVTLGATEHPYHSDGNQCTMYSAEDIVTLYIAYKSFVTQQTTYCNFLRAWIRREEDPAVIRAITYGSELPDDLAQEMNAILERTAEQTQSVVDAMKA